MALRTAKAETTAGVDAAKQGMRLRLFSRELGFEQLSPPVLYEDGNTAISLAHGKVQGAIQVVETLPGEGSIA